MYYKNFITRFILRKNLFRRILWRLKAEWRKVRRNEFDDIQYLFRLIGKDPMVIFDVGANIGFVTFQFRKRFKTSKIFCFEPNPDVFLKLNNAYASDNEITKENIGIGYEAGTLNFYKNNNSGTSSFLKPNEFHNKNMARRYTEMNIPITSIAEYTSQHAIDKIDILKLDIEGFEIEALKGAESLLVLSKIKVIYLEVSFSEMYEGQPLIGDIIEYMSKYNYTLFGFYGINETVYRQTLLTNLLFISNELALEINDQNKRSIINYKN